VCIPETTLAQVACGDVITQNTRLTADLQCPAGTALTIQASGVTLSLAGFTIDGLGSGAVGVDVIAGVTDVQIILGRIRGFGRGIRIGSVNLAE
jgi:hypothetical protein